MHILEAPAPLDGGAGFAKVSNQPPFNDAEFLALFGPPGGKSKSVGFCLVDVVVGRAAGFVGCQ